MGVLLNAQASLMCPHGGTVTVVPAQTAALAGGEPVLTSADAFIVAGCPFNISGTPSPCVSVQWASTCTAGTASGLPALSTESMGLCTAATSAPQGPLEIVSPGQQQASCQ
ncbi:MAG TPA: hypothetical protein VFN61_11930 [Acidimicrobiales bacterium]|nr:hypothetical protein [Acidimicrobiales bacterium]